MRTDPRHSTIPARVRELLPEPCARLARVNAMAWESTDAALLELCRCLVVRLLQPEAR